MKKLQVILTSGRTIQQGIGLEEGKTSEKYSSSVSYVELNPGDAEELELLENDPVEVSTGYGSVVVAWKKGNIDRGIVFFPYGPWSNQVFNSETEGTGMPGYKGVKATILPAKGKKIPSLTMLVEKMREKLDTD